MKVTVISVVVDTLVTACKSLEKKTRERTETISSTALLRSLKYSEGSQRFEETCYHSNSCERLPTNAGVKNSGHRNRIWHRKMRHARNEKRQTAPYERNGTTKSRQD